MWPLPFPWRIIAGRCWLELLRPPPRENLRTKEVVSSKSTKKIQSEENLWYLAFNKTIGPQKGELLGDILPGRQVPKPIFDRRGQDCGIIPVFYLYI
jgi:hypothetical protein